MKTLVRLVVVVFAVWCICYYFDIDLKKALSVFNINNKPGSIATDTSNNEDDNTDDTQEDTPDYGVLINQEDREDYNELIDFMLSQKSGKKLVESFRVLDKNVGGEQKGRSYIADNALCAIALLNDAADKSVSEAEDILKNLSSIQNKDGSWYDFYDYSGQIVKVSGKDYVKSGTGNNGLVLYAYSYYTIMTGNQKFRDTMKKSADFVLTRMDSKDGGLYDTEVSTKGARTVKDNVFGYFGMREYALSSVTQDYNEFKGKIYAADKISGWVADNCLDKGTFIKGYTGKDKQTVLDLDSQTLGALLLSATGRDEKASYGLKNYEDNLLKLQQSVNDMEGYRIDGDTKNKGFIWCEGVCKVPLVELKYDSMDKSRSAVEYIKKYYTMVSKTLTPRGLPYSTNVDVKINVINIESASSSAWGAISIQCLSDDNINSSFFGKEEEVFKKLK